MKSLTLLIKFTGFIIEMYKNIEAALLLLKMTIQDDQCLRSMVSDAVQQIKAILTYVGKTYPNLRNSAEEIITKIPENVISQYEEALEEAAEEWKEILTNDPR